MKPESWQDMEYLYVIINLKNVHHKHVLRVWQKKKKKDSVFESGEDIEALHCFSMN